MSHSARFRHVALLLAPILLSPGPAYAAGRQASATPQEKPVGAACDRAQFRVIVDVGHSAEVPGAFSARGVPEYDYNLRLAQRIGESLKAAGFGKTVVLVTPGAARRGLFFRVAKANAPPADLFLSIHHDSVPERFIETWEYEGKQQRFSDRFRGHSVFVSYENPQAEASLLFARHLGTQLRLQGLRYTPHYAQAFMAERRRDLLDAEAGVYRYDQLIVLKDTRMPAVLLEAGSIVHRDEELQIATPERQSRISAAVAAAVDRFCAARGPAKPPPRAVEASGAARDAHRASTSAQ